MHMGMTSEPVKPEPNKKVKAEISADKEKNHKIEELRKKIEAGYYNGTEIIEKIVSKLLKEI